jgi:predicted Zn-dependent peptidase
MNEAFEYYGAYLNRACYNETAALTLHCLNKHVPLLLPKVADILCDAIFSEEEIAIYKQNSRQRLQVNLKKCDFVANRLIDEYLFGLQHPYGKYSTFEAIEAIERQDLLDFYDQYYRNGKLRLFVAGKLPNDLFSLLNTHFGKLNFNKTPLPEIAHPIVSAKNIGVPINIINDTNGVQGAIRLASHFPNRHHPDFLKVQVLNCLFGGFFGSRLMDNIREEKGYTYGIHSYLQSHVQASAWMVSTEAGREVCEATITEVFKEMALLREDLVEEDELLLVKNYMIGATLGDLDGPFHIIGRWKNIILNGLDEDYFYRSVNSIKTITPEEIQMLAIKYLQPEKFYNLVVI